MVYDLNTDIDRERFKHRVNALYGRRALVECSERKPQRTGKQNRYLHVILGEFAMQTGNPIGIFQTAMQPGIICARRIRQADAQGGRKAPVKS